MVTEKMSSDQIAAMARQYLSPALPRATELVFERGEGMFLYTPEGEKYFDFVCGIAVNSLGHCHPEVVKAAKEQIDRLIHICFVTGYYEPAVLLAKKLAELCPGDLSMVFFSNSGAEVVEGSIKMARYVTGRPAIIAYQGAFHGRSMGAASLTASSVRYRQGYEPFLPSVYHVPFPYCYRCKYRQEPDNCSLDCLSEFDTLFKLQLSPVDVAAIIIEPIQGEGGYIPAPPRYLQGLRELCDQHGILLIFDEIQTGFGRTGDWFAASVYGVTPDIMLLAKSIACGFPLSAIVSRPDLHNKWPRGSHGTTYGANPVSCAASLANIRVIESEGLIGHANMLAGHIRNRLEELQNIYPFIGDVRGMGMMVGAEFITADGKPNGEFVRRLIDASLKKKLLFYSCGMEKQCIRFMPPLNACVEDLDKGFDMFAETLRELAGSVSM